MQPQTGTPTTAQLAGLTPQQKQAYSDQLDAASVAAATDAAKRQANAAYLANCVDHVATCPPAGGGITLPYTAGATLTYNMPTAAGGYAKELLFTLNLTVTPASGTSATYALTAGAPWSLINEIDLLLNGAQVRCRPYFLKEYASMLYRGAPFPSQTIGSANSIPAINTALGSTYPIVVGSGNTWNFVFRLPLNALHKLSAAGCIPIMGSSTKSQVVIQLNPNLLGPDPLLNVLYATGGSGNAVTATGTVKVECIYNDGTNMTSPTPMSLDISGPTCQYIIDTPLNNLVGNIVQRNRITSLLQHYYVVSVIVDGNQSNLFAATTNVLQLEMDQDSVGQNRFYMYGQNNVSINDFWERIRRIWGQDFDQGVIPWVVAESYGQENPDNRMGNQALNMTAGGWTDVNLGYMLGSVNGLGTVVPRVETYLISLNPEGLLQQA
jgi:hypothetical protein